MMIYPHVGAFLYEGDVQHQHRVDFANPECAGWWVLVRPGIPNPKPYTGSDMENISEVPEVPVMFDMIAPHGSIMKLSQRNTTSLIFFLHAVRKFLGWTQKNTMSCSVVVEITGNNGDPVTSYALKIGPLSSGSFSESTTNLLLQHFSDWVFLYHRVGPNKVPPHKLFPTVQLSIPRLMGLGKETNLSKKDLSALAYATTNCVRDLSETCKDVKSVEKSIGFYCVPEAPTLKSARDHRNYRSLMDNLENNQHYRELDMKYHQLQKKVVKLVYAKNGDSRREQIREHMMRTEKKNQKKLTAFFVSSHLAKSNVFSKK